MKAQDLYRFYDKFTMGDDCWIWTGASSRGYGHFWLDGKLVKAHRASYEEFVGPIPKGLEVDHLCRVTKCIRPTHLEPVTPQENVNRSNIGAFFAAKTHCPQNHEYAGDNLKFNSNGSRRCRECSRESSRKSRLKRNQNVN